MTDTAGLVVGAVVHPADVQDRDGAYAGGKLEAALAGKGRRIRAWDRYVLPPGRQPPGAGARYKLPRSGELQARR
jgi:hypothetical protein